MRTLRRAVVVALLPAALLAVALAGGRPAAGVAQQAGPEHPVIDNDYMYSQLYKMSTSFIYRVSGADGPPEDPSSPFNLPPTVNGTNEFYAYWKQQMTNPSANAMGPLGRAVTASDHFFPLRISGQTAPFHGDVAEVTIPGSTCAGERVLISGHNDSTPTSTQLATQAAAGNFPAAWARLHSGNAGNGSPYDATSGEAMGMAEFQALLRWYQANGTWPKRTIKVGLFDAEETGLQGSSFYSANLLPTGPQGKYVMVANMDQNGMEYPAFHWGTDHYLNNIVGGGVGPWYTNINAVPLAANPIYPDNGPGSPWQKIQANLPAVNAFRDAVHASVTDAFQVLGSKYNFSVPLENPLRLDQVGSTPVAPGTRTVPAYTQEDQDKFSPVVDDRLGRTDQVSFIRQGIPGYGIVGAYDSSNAEVGGFENPYPANYVSKPTLGQYAGYDTTNDTIANLNYWASGTVHGPGGPATPSIGLLRALELPATWTDYVIQRDAYGGADAHPQHPIAYFETDPVQPKTTTTINFDASFSRNDAGRTNGLVYVWDFGDDTIAVGGPKITHTYSAPRYADVKLIVLDGSKAGGYRQAVPVGFDPAAADAPAAPNTDSCGSLTTQDQAGAVSTAQRAAASVAPGQTVRKEDLTG
jgi:hypothetical protein